MCHGPSSVVSDHNYNHCDRVLSLIHSMFSVRYGEYTIYGYIAFSAIIEAVMIRREIYYLSMAIASRDNGFSIVYTAT